MGPPLWQRDFNRELSSTGRPTRNTEVRIPAIVIT
jgi:hypothetical protein